MIRSLFPYPALVVLAAPLFSAEENDPRVIFQKLEASVVHISDSEGGGSGVVLTDDGLILTNYHVVSSPLPLSVEATVTEKGSSIRKTFNSVSVTRVHPHNDLALLKVDAPGFRFKPARIALSGRETAAGGVCFAMGYPYVPGQEKPVLTITRGIISSANRTVEDSPYIQLDAAINPGNSGGALVNGQGVVIGIPTLKFEGADRIGLAAPVAELKLGDFVKPEDRKGNPVKAARFADLASALMMRDALSLGTDSESLPMAVYLGREALAEDPNNAGLLARMASIYLRLRKDPVALVYAETAVRKAPRNFYARTVLAQAYDNLKQPEKGAQIRLRCLPLPVQEEYSAARSSLIQNLIDYHVSTGDLVRATYLVSWSQEISKEPVTMGQRLVLQKASDSLSQAVVDEIMTRKTGHSLADMEAIANRPKSSRVAPPESPPSGGNGQITARVATGFAANVELKDGVTATLMDASPDVTYDKGTGMLHWNPPVFSTTTQAKALFLLKNPDGSEEKRVQLISR